MNVISHIHQSESGWTVLSMVPTRDEEGMIVNPPAQFIRTEALEASGLEIKPGDKIRS